MVLKIYLTIKKISSGNNARLQLESSNRIDNDGTLIQASFRPSGVTGIRDMQQLSVFVVFRDFEASPMMELPR